MAETGSFIHFFYEATFCYDIMKKDEAEFKALSSMVKVEYKSFDCKCNENGVAKYSVNDINCHSF